MKPLNYDYVIQQLKKDGFKIKTHTANPNTCVLESIKHGVVIAVGEQGQWYRSIDNRVAVDNAEAFNKWSQVPVSLRLPVDYKRLKAAIEKAGSQEGYEISNDFGQIDFEPYED
jgi:hypothetical protein